MKIGRDTHDFEVYYGEGSDFHSDETPVPLSKSEEIVVRMLCDLLDLGHHVVTDNWYTSLRLARFLLTMDTDITGTVNPLRGPPPALREIPLRKKGSAFMRCGDVLVCKYEDRKSVYSLTTRYSADVVDKTKKYFNGQVYFKVPIQIAYYNEFMGSVDKADQVLQPYSWKRKSLAWFKKLGLHFIDRMLLNSFILYDNQHPQYRKDYAYYMQEVCIELIRRHCPAGKKILEEYECQQTPRRVRPRKGPPQRAHAPRRRIPVRVISSSSPSSGDDQPTPGRWAELERRKRHQARRKEATAQQETIIAQEAREQQTLIEQQAVRERA